MSPDDFVEDHPSVNEFARLARQHLKSDPPRKGDVGFARVQARLSSHVEPRPRAALWAFACAAAVVLFAVGGWMFSAYQPVAYEVVNGELDGDVLTGGNATRIAFSDGSHVELETGAQAQIVDLTSRGGSVRVSEGAVHVAIAKKPGAEWFVLAGPYTVRVTGTAFDVRWSPKPKRFELVMQSGAVVVSGPLAASGVSLRAGQRLVADQKLTVEEKSEASTAANSEPAPSEPEAASESIADISFDDLPMLEPEPQPEPARRVEPGRPLSWREHVARGHFRIVLEEAERRGIERTLKSSNLSDLSALADAARYGRRVELARRALTAQRERFGGTQQAREAAFFLGSLSANKAAALEWYDRYLQESPNGVYASQSLGRKLVIVYEQQRTAEARQLAEQYKSRYPNGPYASTARKVLGEAAAKDSNAAGVRARSGR